MDFIREKIRVMTEKLDSLRVTERTAVSYDWIPCSGYKQENVPPGEGADWVRGESRAVFEGVDCHFWLHPCLPETGPVPGTELRLSAKTGREGQWDATNPQFTVIADGTAIQALDVNHTWLSMEGVSPKDLYLYLYTGMTGGTFPVDLCLERIDLETEGLLYDLRVPYEAMCVLDASGYDYVRIRDCLDRALFLLDLRDPGSDAFKESVKSVRAFLRENFYEGICGQSEAEVSCIGHTHIDVAWLWTVAQTREKAQRSFSTAVRMMDRWPSYRFMSSQPQLYRFVKDNDPALYGRIREAVKRGQWEPEGAMWLEADTNLPHGESLIRQILYGKRFFREEFGIESHILWLPDVFGYSGALPQILRKCGVDCFFTAKMSWSETNSMPDDTFVWEGIDGSRIFASIIRGYVNTLSPATLLETWKNFKDPSLTNRTLLTFGYGDGGGGPTHEMMEYAERLRCGLPGIPRARIEKAGTYFEKVREDFESSTKALRRTPRWVGEMYLEMHRGTYTSIAKNKRNNRRSELLYLMAESLSAIDLVWNGGEYPSETFRRNTEVILLNQFHDIIPGSSIKEVYEVTDAEYAKVIAEGEAVAAGKLAAIRRNLRTEGGIFVFNPTPFTVTAPFRLEDRTFLAQSVPPHGWAVVSECEVSGGVQVSEYRIENDLVRVEFNGRYHIVSLYDKEAGREVIEAGAEANLLEVFEDYPRDYDAWEITSYYRQKMWTADDVASVSLLEDGIRIGRRYGRSRITQEVRLTPGSKRIDFETWIDWHEDHVLLKAAFPVSIRSMRATYEIQFGNLERPTHRNTSWDAARFEVCAHRWADLSEGGYGVSLLNDCKYGYSIEDNVMELTLLKAASYPNPEADRGEHHFTYALYPHTGDYREGGTVREAYLLNTPLIAERTGKTDGTLPERACLLSCDRENVLVETIKKAEEGDALVVRLYDAYSQKAEAVLTPHFPFREVWRCDMLEREEEKLSPEDGKVRLSVSNFEIVTLKFVR